MKQTAVEFIEKGIQESGLLPYKWLLDLIDQAKQMEDKQKEKSFVEGYKTRAEFSNLIFDEASELFAKELFNKTFKSE